MKLAFKVVWERFLLVLASRCFSSGETAIKIDPPQADSMFDLPEAGLLASGELDVRCSTFIRFFHRSNRPLFWPALRRERRMMEYRNNGYDLMSHIEKYDD